MAKLDISIMFMIFNRLESIKEAVDLIYKVKSPKSHIDFDVARPNKKGEKG